MKKFYLLFLLMLITASTVQSADFSWSVSASPTSGGTVGVTVNSIAVTKISSFKVPTGATVVLIPVAKTGYVFDKVFKNNVDMGQQKVFGPVSSAHKIKVTFKKLPIITSTASPSKYGTITPLGKTIVSFGANQNFQFTPNAGYEIKSIKVNGKAIPIASSYLMENVQKNQSISVTYQIKKWSVTVSADPNGKVSPSGIVKIPNSSKKSFTATPKKGYRAGILLDGALVTPENALVNKPVKYNLTNVTSNHTIKGIFVLAGQPFKSNYNTAISIVGLGESILVTNSATPTIAGVASSSAGISYVKWENTTSGTSGNATGTTSWTKVIPVVLGDNVLTFEAFSEDGSSSKITTTLTYNPAIDFTSPLSTSKDLIFTGISTDVTFTIGLSNTTGAVVQLVQVMDNKTEQIVGTMVDNGVLPDEIEKDGNFTVKKTLSSSTTGYLKYRAKVTRGSSIFRSEVTQIWVTSPATSQDVKEVVDIANNAKKIFLDSVKVGLSGSEAAVKIKDTLTKDPNVGVVDTNGAEGVWWVTKDGYLGAFHPTFVDTKSGGGGAVGKTPVYFPPTKTGNYPASFLSNMSTYDSAYIGTNDIILEPKNEVKSTRAIIISPYINNPKDGPNFNNSDDYYGPWKSIQDKNACSLTPDTAIVNNGAVNVSLDSFKALEGYGYIHFSTHGDNFYNGLINKWQDEWGTDNWLKGALSQVILYSGLVIPKKTDGTFDITGYEEDLKAKRIAMGADGCISILPSFFSHYVSELPNSLVVISACRSMYNNSLANAFLAKGAGAVFGYSDYVKSGYAKNTSKKIIDDMLNGKEFSVAYAAAVTAYGDNDSGKPAYIRKAGADDLVLSSGTLKNGGFEDGILTPWTKAGDGRVISQLGGTSPTEGSYMGIISTGLGYTTSNGSVTQDFCLTAKADKLTFDWNFFSEEFKEYIGSSYQDAFQVSISVYDTTTKTWKTADTLFNKAIDDLGSMVTRSDIGFDRKDGEDDGTGTGTKIYPGVFDTGWENANISLTAYAGKHVRLKFFATDVGDSIYDTAILIDNIKVVEKP